MFITGLDRSTDPECQTIKGWRRSNYQTVPTDLIGNVGGGGGGEGLHGYTPRVSQMPAVNDLSKLKTAGSIVLRTGSIQLYTCSDCLACASGKQVGVCDL